MAAKPNDSQWKKVRAVFARQIENWVESLPSEVRSRPFFRRARNETEPMTPDDVVRHIKQGTVLGDHLVEQAVELAMTNALEHAPKPPPDAAYSTLTRREVRLRVDAVATAREIVIELRRAVLKAIAPNRARTSKR